MNTNSGGRPRYIDTYTPRSISAFGQGYSVFVRVLKFALPLTALVIIGVLVARLSKEAPQKIAVMPAGTEKTTPGQIELIGAKYEGMDEQGRPYTVSADRATRAMDAPDAVSFVNPLADITLRDKTWVAVKAKTGFLDRTTESLTLKGEVTVFHDSGYEMQLQDLAINLKQKTAATMLPVVAQGPMGTISAQNMSVENQGDLIVFGGPATLTILSLSPKKVHG